MAQVDFVTVTLLDVHNERVHSDMPSSVLRFLMTPSQ